MRGSCILARQSRSAALLVAALLFAACSTQVPDLAPPPDEPPAVIEVPAAVVEPAPEIPTEPAPAPPERPRLPPIAIILSNSQPAYLDVAVELAAFFADHTVYDLSAESLPPVAVLRSINDGNASAVVAIGLRAAQSAVAMSGVPVVFSQVFNHQEHGLLNANSRGVAAVAPLDAQLDAWKKIDPAMKRVGLIIGDGHEDLVEHAEVAADRHGIELYVRVANSDQETLYFFRRMVRDIDGFWLFPDNRILSARVLEQMLEDANRHQVPVVVPNDSLLKMGASISITTVAADIAATIAGVVRKIQAGQISKVPPLTELSEVRVAVNEQMPTKQAVADASSTQ